MLSQFGVTIYELTIARMARHCSICEHQQCWFILDSIDIGHNVIPILRGDAKAFACGNVCDAPSPTVARAIALLDLLKLVNRSVNCQRINKQSSDILDDLDASVVSPHPYVYCVIAVWLFHVVSMSLGDVSSVSCLKPFVKYFYSLFSSSPHLRKIRMKFSNTSNMLTVIALTVPLDMSLTTHPLGVVRSTITGLLCIHMRSPTHTSE